MENKKIILAMALVVTLLLLFFCSYLKITKPFKYAGTLENTKVVLSSRVNAEIVSFPHLEGDQLKADQIILTLDDELFKINAKQLDAEYQRVGKLYQNGAATKEELEKVERAKRENDLNLKWCEIRAPLNGTIITKFREEREYLNIGTPILSVADLYDIWAYFYVPHDAIYQLKVGDSVVGILPELPKVKFKGTIAKISEEAEFTPKNVQTRAERTKLVYGIKVSFDNPELLLKAGMTIEATFEK